jgi:hypothetical protein
MKWRDYTPLTKYPFKKSLLFKVIDKRSTFRPEVLFYSDPSSKGAIASRKSISPSDRPANKSASLPLNGEAGSNVIDVSE